MRHLADERDASAQFVQALQRRAADQFHRVCEWVSSRSAAGRGGHFRLQGATHHLHCMRNGALLHLDLRRRKLLQELIQLPGTGQVQHADSASIRALRTAAQVQRAPFLTDGSDMRGVPVAAQRHIQGPFFLLAFDESHVQGLFILRGSLRCWSRMVAGKARGPQLGGPQQGPSNAACDHSGRNPEERGGFRPSLRCSSLMYSRYILSSRLALGEIRRRRSRSPQYEQALVPIRCRRDTFADVPLSTTFQPRRRVPATDWARPAPPSGPFAAGGDSP